jgi:hypothetical protein
MYTKKPPRQRDVAGNARSLFAQRLLGDLHDDFLALLEQVRNQRGAARLLRPRSSSAMPVLRTASTIVATSTIPASASAPRGLLHARSIVARNARPLRLCYCRRHAGISGIDRAVRRCFSVGGVDALLPILPREPPLCLPPRLALLLEFFRCRSDCPRHPEPALRIPRNSLPLPLRPRGFRVVAFSAFGFGGFHFFGALHSVGFAHRTGVEAQ